MHGLPLVLSFALSRLTPRVIHVCRRTGFGHGQRTSRTGKPSEEASDEEEESKSSRSSSRHRNGSGVAFASRVGATPPKKKAVEAARVAVGARKTELAAAAKARQSESLPRQRKSSWRIQRKGRPRERRRRTREARRRKQRRGLRAMSLSRWNEQQAPKRVLPAKTSRLEHYKQSTTYFCCIYVLYVCCLFSIACLHPRLRFRWPRFPSFGCPACMLLDLLLEEYLAFSAAFRFWGPR